MIEQDLRDKLIQDIQLHDLFAAQDIDPEQDGAIAYNHTPEKCPKTRIWFVRSETVNDNLLTGERIIEHAIYDMEFISDDFATSMQFARRVQDLMNPFRGPMGATWVQGCDVTDQSDDYVYNQEFADEGLAAAALRLEIMI